MKIIHTEKSINNAPNLTAWQRFTLVFRYLIWLCLDKTKRKSWEHYKKGIEHHQHKFDKPYQYNGQWWFRCSHVGCFECVPFKSQRKQKRLFKKQFQKKKSEMLKYYERQTKQSS